MACVCCLCIDFIALFCVRCSVIILHVVWFLVCVFWLCCVVLRFVVSLACRACMCCCCLVFVSVFSYCLNDPPVCDCILYVP